jgi:hypothetical protein
VWPAALECARAATMAVPDGDLLHVTSRADAPELAANSWFWLGISEKVQGQAIIALVRTGTQSQLTQVGPLVSASVSLS